MFLQHFAKTRSQGQKLAEFAAGARQEAPFEEVISIVAVGCAHSPAGTWDLA
jgi:hypothetical protein